jgi:O-antigen/teichoic acid export membrane protein
MNVDKSKKIKDLSKNTILFTISSFGSRILSFFLVPLYTYVLSTSEYGTVDLINTTVQLLIPILTLNIQDAVLRFSLDDEYSPYDVIDVDGKVIAISSGVLVLALFVLWALGIITITPNYIIFLFVLFISGAINNNLSMYLKARDRVRLLAFWGIINMAITCVFNIVLLLVMKLGVNGYLISFVSGTIVADIGMIITGGVFHDIKRGKWSTNIVRSILIYSAPLIANSIGWWINNASDRYILTFFCGTALNGIYAVSYKIPSILSAVQSVFYNAWSVSAITEFDKDDSDGFIGNVYTAYSSMSILACSCIMVLNIFIAKILYSKDFFSAWHYIPFLLVGTAFNGLGLFNGCIYTAAKKTKDVSITTIIGATINTALNFILIPFYGAYGAAFATMVGYFFIWLIRLVRMRNIIVMKVNWKNNIMLMVILFLQCVFATATGNFVLQIPFLFILCILERRTIAKVYKAAKNMISARTR